MNQSYDLLILGSGSTAFAAAIKAAELGKSAVMTESRTIGGPAWTAAAYPRRTYSRPHASTGKRSTRASLAWARRRSISTSAGSSKARTRSSACTARRSTTRSSTRATASRSWRATPGSSIRTLRPLTVLPRTIFTDPQVATVGLTDEEANGAGYRCSCNTVPIHIVPRAGAVRDERGVIKMVADASSGKVLGVSMVGRDAGEVIHEAAMGMRFGATVHDFIDMVHVYPTMAEALKIAALSFYKDVSKLSCCAE